MKSLSIIIIEDEESFARSLKRGLSDKYNKGEVEHFVDGKKAIDKIDISIQQGVRNIIVLLDYSLSRSHTYTGERVIKELNGSDRYKDVSLIIMTGKNPVEAQSNIKGIKAILYKNFPIFQLINIIDGIIEYDAVYDKTAKLYKEILGAENCLLFRYYYNRNSTRLVGTCGEASEIEKHQIQPFKEESINSLKEIGSYTFEAWKNIQYGKYSKEQLSIEHSFVLRIPLIEKGRILGFIDAFFKNKQDFKTPDNHIKALVEQSIGAIRGAKLAQNNHHLQELNQAVAAMPNGGPDGKFYQDLLIRIKKITYATSLTIYTIAGEQTKRLKKREQLLQKSNYPDYLNLNDLTKQMEGQIGSYNVDRTEINIPIRRNIEILGWIKINSERPHLLSADDIDLVYAMASLAASVIKSEIRINLLRKLNELIASKHRIIGKFGKKKSEKEKSTNSKEDIDQSKDLQEIYQFAVNAIQQLTGAEVNFWKVGDTIGNAVIDGKNTNKLSIIAHTSGVPYPKGTLNNDPIQYPIAELLENPEKGHIKMDEEGLSKLSMKEKNKYKFFEKLTKDGWISFNAIPVIGSEANGGAEKLGVISLYSKHSLFDSDIHIAKTFAKQVASALQIHKRNWLQKKLTNVSRDLKHKATEPLDELAKAIIRYANDDTRSEYSLLVYDDCKKSIFYNRSEEIFLEDRKGQAEVVEILSTLIDEYGKPVFIHDIDKPLIFEGNKIEDEKKVKRNIALTNAIKILKSSNFILDHNVKALGVTYLPSYHIEAETDADHPPHPRHNGYIFVFYTAPKYFSYDEIDCFKVYSNLVAALLKEHAQQKLFEGLYDSGLIIGKGKDASTVAENILSAMKDLFDYSSASIQEIPSVTERRILIANKVFHAKGSKKRESLRDTSLLKPINQDQLIQTIYNSKKPGLLSDIDDKQNPLAKYWKPTTSTEHIKSWVGIPLIDEEKVIGLMTLGHIDRNHYTEHSIEGIKLIAQQAAIAISKTRQKPWINLGQLSGSLAHRIGNKGGLIRLKIKELAKEINKIENENLRESIQKKINNVDENNSYMLKLAQELFKPAYAANDALYPKSIDFLLKDAMDYADLDDIEVVYDGSKNKSIEVKANNFFIEMFLEVMNNAAKAMNNSIEKVLRIETSISQSNIQIRFIDTGKGLTEEDLREMENIFYTSSNYPTKWLLKIYLKDSIKDKQKLDEILNEILDQEDRKSSKKEGQGFGLWWIKEFLDYIGGEIKGENNKSGKGSTFTITLPVSKKINQTTL